MIFPFLSFLAVGSSSAQVITWLANLTEASQIIDYICMCTIYIFFYRALKAQGIDRSTLPYVGWLQPYCAWAGLVAMALTVACYGYTTFLPGCKFFPCCLRSLLLVLPLRMVQKLIRNRVGYRNLLLLLYHGIRLPDSLHRMESH